MGIISSHASLVSVQFLVLLFIFWFIDSPRSCVNYVSMVIVLLFLFFAKYVFHKVVEALVFPALTVHLKKSDEGVFFNLRATSLIKYCKFVKKFQKLCLAFIFSAVLIDGIRMGSGIEKVLNLHEGNDSLFLKLFKGQVDFLSLVFVEQWYEMLQKDVWFHLWFSVRILVVNYFQFFRVQINL